MIQQFLAGIANHLAKPVIYPLENPVYDYANAHRSCPDNTEQVGFAFLQSFLRLLALNGRCDLGRDYFQPLELLLRERFVPGDFDQAQWSRFRAEAYGNNCINIKRSSYPRDQFYKLITQPLGWQPGFGDKFADPVMYVGLTVIYFRFTIFNCIEMHRSGFKGYGYEWYPMTDQLLQLVSHLAF